MVLRLVKGVYFSLTHLIVPFYFVLYCIVFVPISYLCEKRTEVECTILLRIVLYLYRYRTSVKSACGNGGGVMAR